jgi:hypothetical protein
VIAEEILQDHAGREELRGDRGADSHAVGAGGVEAECFGWCSIGC